MRDTDEHSAIRMGDLVVTGRGGPIMKVARVEASEAVCVWRARHRVVERVLKAADLSRVAPDRLVPIWGYWGGPGVSRP